MKALCSENKSFAFRRVSAVLLVAVASCSLSGCVFRHRSVAAVCKVWATDGVALEDRLAHPGGSRGLLSSLADLAAEPGRVADLMDKMGSVAPKPDESSFKDLADAFRSVGKSAGGGVSNPISSLTSALATGASVTGPAEHVNTFLANNCGLPAT